MPTALTLEYRARQERDQTPPLVPLAPGEEVRWLLTRADGTSLLRSSFSYPLVETLTEEGVRGIAPLSLLHERSDLGPGDLRALAAGTEEPCMQYQVGYRIFQIGVTFVDEAPQPPLREIDEPAALWDQALPDARVNYAVPGPNILGKGWDELSPSTQRAVTAQMARHFAGSPAVRSARLLREASLAEARIFLDGHHDVTSGYAYLGGSSTGNVSGDASVIVEGRAAVLLRGEAVAIARDEAVVNAYDRATVFAGDHATVRAGDGTTVTADDQVTVQLAGDARADLSGRATATAWDRARVHATDEARVTLHDTATGEATYRAHLTVLDRATGIVRLSAEARVSGPTAQCTAGDEARVVIDQGRVDASHAATVHASGSAVIRLRDHATCHAEGSAKVTALGRARVFATGDVNVEGRDEASSRLTGRATGTFRGVAEAHGSEKAHLTFLEAARGSLGGEARGEVADRAGVHAFDHAQVTLRDEAVVTAEGRARVQASGHARVHARGEALVEASDTAAVAAYELAKVTLSGQATVGLDDFATARAMPGFAGSIVADVDAAYRDGGIQPPIRRLPWDPEWVQVHPEMRRRVVEGSQYDGPTMERASEALCVGAAKAEPKAPAPGLAAGATPRVRDAEGTGNVARDRHPMAHSA